MFCIVCPMNRCMTRKILGWGGNLACEGPCGPSQACCLWQFVRLPFRLKSKRYVQKISSVFGLTSCKYCYMILYWFCHCWYNILEHRHLLYKWHHFHKGCVFVIFLPQTSCHLNWMHYKESLYVVWMNFQVLGIWIHSNLFIFTSSDHVRVLLQIHEE